MMLLLTKLLIYTDKIHKGFQIKNFCILIFLLIFCAGCSQNRVSPFYKLKPISSKFNRAYSKEPSRNSFKIHVFLHELNYSNRVKILVNGKLLDTRKERMKEMSNWNTDNVFYPINYKKDEFLNLEVRLDGKTVINLKNIDTIKNNTIELHLYPALEDIRYTMIISKISIYNDKDVEGL